jgi:energy-coupling factor transporter ATP-binding protein EcfA2
MSNPIKYSTGSESLSLKKGNFYIGTGDVGKGPTSTTGYYNGITPPSGGYTIYLNKESDGPSIYTASNDAQLISLTNSIAGQSYTTVNECLVYFAGQTDKVCLNRDYEGIVTDGLIFNLDAGFTPSYPKNGTTWYDIKGTNNGTLINGPTYSSNDGGSVVFDGTNDYVNINLSQTFSEQSFTLSFFFKNLSTGDWTDFITIITTTNNSMVFEKGGNNGEPLTTGYLKVYPIFLSPTLTNVHLPGMYVNDSNIHSFTITANETSWNLYDNGELYGSGSVSGTPLNYNRITIGTDITRINRFSKNQNYVTLLYNRALTAEEVLQNYNAQKGRFGL